MSRGVSSPPFLLPLFLPLSLFLSLFLSLSSPVSVPFSRTRSFSHLFSFLSTCSAVSSLVYVTQIYAACVSLLRVYSLSLSFPRACKRHRVAFRRLYLSATGPSARGSVSIYKSITGTSVLLSVVFFSRRTLASRETATRH